VNRKGENTACGCVLRAIFRACYHRFKECAAVRVSPEHATTLDRTGGWGRRDEEYMADFLLIANRELDAEEHKIFRYHLLLGADWRLCCRKLGMDRGNFFHAVYRIQQKLGKLFREMEPYPLFPVNEYFTTGMRDKVSATKVVSIDQKRHRNLADSVPLRKAA
jgi:hypothetical protein